MLSKKKIVIFTEILNDFVIDPSKNVKIKYFWIKLQLIKTHNIKKVGER